MNGRFAQGTEFLHAVAAYLANTEAMSCAISIAFRAVKVVAVVGKCLCRAVCQMASNEDCGKHDVLKCGSKLHKNKRTFFRCLHTKVFELGAFPEIGYEYIRVASVCQSMQNIRASIIH